MLDRNEFVYVLESFARLQITAEGVDTVLKGLVEATVGGLDLAGAGVVVVDDDRRHLATAVHARPGVVLDACHDHARNGPCLATVTHGRTVRIPDIGVHGEPWPEMVAEARRVGVGAVAGLPMMRGDSTIGALILFSAQPRGWRDEDIGMVRVLTEMASGYVVHASALAHYEQMSAQLQQALESRVVIEQAKGIIANARGVGIDAAYQLIRRHARSHNATVRRVSEAIVTLALRV